MASRRILIGACLAVVAIGGTLLADWLIVTDEERLEEFVRSVTGRIENARIEHALSYTDPEHHPIDLSVRHQNFHFDKENAQELRLVTFRYLAQYDGDRLALLQKSIQVRGQQARLVVDTLSRRGRTSVEYELRKVGDRWIVREIHVR